MRKIRTGILVALTIAVLIWTFVSNPFYMDVLSSFSDRTVFGRLLPNFNKIVRQQNFNELTKLVEDKEGTYAIYIKDLNNQDVYQYNESERFYAASLYKTPIAVQVVRMVQKGEITFNDPMVYAWQDSSSGTGSINTNPVGTEFTVDQVLDNLLKESDNTAQNMFVRYYGYEELKKGFELADDKKFFEDNTSSAEAQGKLYENIVISSYLNLNNRQLLLSKMSQTSFDDRINKGLAHDINFAHKIGNWGETGSWHDCGVATKDNKNVVVCVMSRYTSYNDFISVTEEVGRFVNMLF